MLEENPGTIVPMRGCVIDVYSSFGRLVVWAPYLLLSIFMLRILFSLHLKDWKEYLCKIRLIQSFSKFPSFNSIRLDLKHIPLNLTASP